MFECIGNNGESKILKNAILEVEFQWLKVLLSRCEYNYNVS